MRVLLTAFLLTHLTACGLSPETASDLKIVGGSDASLADFPWQISIQSRKDGESPFVHYCGGALISERQFVTAAHCFNFVESYENHLVAFGGDGSLEGLSGNAMIAAVQKHPEYSYGIYDAAVVTLTEAIDFSKHPNVRPIAFSSRRPSEGEKVVVSGWGATAVRLKDDGYYDLEWPERLQATSLKMLAPAASPFWTEERYKKYFPPNLGSEKIQMETFKKDITLALFGDEKKGGCRGDSGGPAVIVEEGEAPVLVGLTSQGTDTTTCALITLYTAIDAVRGWLETEIH